MADSLTRNLFLSLIAVLLGVGVLMVHSASITSWPTEFERVYLSRHALFVGVGVAAGWLCSRVPACFWYRASPWLFVGLVLLLIAVLVPGVGTRVNGAQRWIRVGPLSLQPSELAKLALPLLLVRMIVGRRNELGHWWRGTVPVLIPVLVAVPLVFLEPDLGTSVFLVTGAAAALWAAGWPLRNFACAGILAGVVALSLVSWKPYQVKRITGFIQSWTNPEQAPYQVRQSLATIGAGGVGGVGVGKGWQKLSFLPEANTDFVIAVVGEEFGAVGTLGLVTVWIALYAAGLRLIAHLPRHSYAYLVGFTLLTQLALQAALNVAVVTAMVPPKGIPHPLMSYGGTNLLVNLMSLGVVLSLSEARADRDAVVLQ